MISVQNLGKTFGSLQAISNVTFSIEPGKLCGLVGPNGAGKSTLFKLIMGMLEPDTGEIHIADEKVQFGDTDYKNRIGFVPENPALYEYLTGSEFLAFVAAAKKIPLENRQAEIHQWLDFFHLTAKSGELIKNYSHGMRRKISLCSALIGSPPILLLDEATNGLDPEASFKFKEYLKKYCQNQGAVLFSSHIIETVEHLCDRIIILHGGKVRQELNREDWENLRKQGSSLEQLFISIVNSEVVE